MATEHSRRSQFLMFMFGDFKESQKRREVLMEAHIKVHLWVSRVA